VKVMYSPEFDELILIDLFYPYEDDYGVFGNINCLREDGWRTLSRYYYIGEFE